MLTNAHWLFKSTPDWLYWIFIFFKGIWALGNFLGYKPCWDINCESRFQISCCSSEFIINWDSFVPHPNHTSTGLMEFFLVSPNVKTKKASTFQHLCHNKIGTVTIMCSANNSHCWTKPGIDRQINNQFVLLNQIIHGKRSFKCQ